MGHLRSITVADCRLDVERVYDTFIRYVRV